MKLGEGIHALLVGLGRDEDQRGPIGLRELCTYKYLVRGDGQIRE